MVPRRHAQANAHRLRQRGQAAVELALGLPLVFLALLAVVQVVLVARDQVAVIHAAREGARAAAVGDVADATAAARQALEGGLVRASVTTRRQGDQVTVVVRSTSHTDVPLIGHLVGDITVTGSATMRREP